VILWQTKEDKVIKEARATDARAELMSRDAVARVAQVSPASQGKEAAKVTAQDAVVLQA
jgi:hypothetical protein